MPAFAGRAARNGLPAFGQVALRFGFITRVDLRRALARQRRMDQAGERHKLIGLLLVEDGAMSTSQLIRVLRRYQSLCLEPRNGAVRHP